MKKIALVDWVHKCGCGSTIKCSSPETCDIHGKMCFFYEQHHYTIKHQECVRKANEERGE